MDQGGRSGRPQGLSVRKAYSMTNSKQTANVNSLGAEAMK
jgi:hypothetical protein